MSLRFDPDALRRMREQQGISQGQLSRQVAGNRIAVNAWECGRKVPTLDTIGRLADALGIEYTDLISRTSREAVSA
ncbi:helix-turn-helix transcriptional regulator [Streptomyces sp. NPDC096095]|uniref:helix-turn-helix domain-containing protein n=1 Tax=Streptomyces sp. NPDC096095 TaxID=3155545 RepID=UPI0033237463